MIGHNSTVYIPYKIHGIHMESTRDCKVLAMYNLDCGVTQ